jgi:hypothetical protein
MQKLVNALAIDLTFKLPDGKRLELPRAAKPVALEKAEREIGRVGGVPVFLQQEYFRNLPPQVPGSFYVTTFPIARAAAAAGRPDFLATPSIILPDRLHAYPVVPMGEVRLLLKAVARGKKEGWMAGMASRLLEQLREEGGAQ